MALKRWIWITALALLTAVAGFGQTFSCPSGFNTTPSNPCGVQNGFPYTGTFAITANGGANISGTTLILQPAATVHNANSFIYQTKVNDTAWNSSFDWTPNSWNLEMWLGTVTNQGNFNNNIFSGGAGCEGGVYQGYPGMGFTFPNNIWGIDFDSSNNLSTGTSGFIYSNVKILSPGQSNCLPADGTEDFYTGEAGISTSPVALNSPPSTLRMSTGDTYHVNLYYTGNNLTVTMYDVTLSGTCSPKTSASCFTYTWNNLNLPSIITSTTTWLGFAGSTNGTSNHDLDVYDWVFSSVSTPASPTFSPTAGTYGSTQSVAISDATGSTIICYNTTGGPATDGIAACSIGTLYTGAISVPKGQTIYAVAGGTGFADSPIANSAYNITGFAAQPTFYPGAGIWQGAQTVFLTAAQGGVICYSTSTTPATNGTTGCTTGTLYSGPITVSSNETINAVAGGTGFTDSGVGTAAYTISPYATFNSATYTPANSPTFSPVGGTYTGTQTVSLASSTTGSNICYIASATTPAIMPQPDQLGGCTVGTNYTSPITISSSKTIYAIAGQVVGPCCSNSGAPSSQIQASFTISASTGGPVISGKSAFKGKVTVK